LTLDEPYAYETFKFNFTLNFYPQISHCANQSEMVRLSMKHSLENQFGFIAAVTTNE